MAFKSLFEKDEFIPGHQNQKRSNIMLRQKRAKIMILQILHVNNDPRRMKNEKCDDDVEENQEQVQLLLHLLFGAKSLNLDLIGR